jgi:hypothetical protein
LAYWDAFLLMDSASAQLQYGRTVSIIASIAPMQKGQSQCININAAILTPNRRYPQ